MRFKSAWAEDAYWKTIDGKKVYFIGKRMVGEKYTFVRALVTSGGS